MRAVTFVGVRRRRFRTSKDASIGGREIVPMAVQMRLDTDCKRMIRSCEPRDGVGCLSLWSLRDQRRNVALRCDVRATKGDLARRNIAGRIQTCAEGERPYQYDESLTEGGGGALEPCKSL